MAAVGIGRRRRPSWSKASGGAGGWAEVGGRPDAKGAHRLAAQRRPSGRALPSAVGRYLCLLAMGVGGRPRQVEALWGPLIGSWVHVEAVAFKSQVGPVSDAADRSVAAGRRAKMYGTSV